MKLRLNPNRQRGTLLLPLIVILVLIIILGYIIRAIINGIYHFVPRPPPDDEQVVPPGWFTESDDDPQPILVTNAVFSVLRSTTMAGWPDVSGWQVIGTVKGPDGAAPEFSDPDPGFMLTNQCGFYVTRFEFLEVTEEWP